MHVRYRWLSQCSRVFLWAHCLHIERGREWLNRLNAETLWKGQLLKGNHAVNFSLGKTAFFNPPENMFIFKLLLLYLVTVHYCFVQLGGFGSPTRTTMSQWWSLLRKRQLGWWKRESQRSKCLKSTQKVLFYSIAKNKHETFPIDFQTLCIVWSQWRLV